MQAEAEAGPIAEPAPPVPPPADPPPPDAGPVPPELALIAAHLDAEFYRAACPGSLGPGDDPARHYHATGWREGRDPRPDFSTAGYLALHPDIAAAGIDPFLHWLQAGRAEGRATLPAGARPPGRFFASLAAREAFLADLAESGLFDPVWHAARHPEAAADPWGHYAEEGVDALADPCPGFSCAFYLASSPDIAAAGMHPVEHYLRWGGAERRQPHPLVSGHWLAREFAAELAGGGIPFGNPLAAFQRCRDPLATRPVRPRPAIDLARLAPRLGLTEAAHPAEVFRALALLPPADLPDPNPLFSAEWVRRQVAVPPGESALSVYLARQGIGITPHPLFRNEAVVNAMPGWPSPEGLSLLDAFLMPDVPETLSPHPLLDGRHLLATAGPARPKGLHPVLHYLAGGWREGAEANAFFDSAAYADRFPGAAEGGMTPIEHYARHGRAPWADVPGRFAQKIYLARMPGLLGNFPGTPLEHYVLYGRFEGRQARPAPAHQDDFAAWDEVRAEIRAAFAMPEREPQVSVIIPVHNQLSHTLRAVRAILRAGDRARLEIMIADDASTDGTEAMFADLPGLTYLRNPENLGFLRTCNSAAARARAPFLFFLNNDTAVLPGWIDSLLATAARHPEAGLIGSRLLYPDGTLQEAGGFIWRNGGGANAGRDGDPEEPGFAFLRDADYVSGAAILVPRAVWRELGGFDEAYAPAYCEDSDLALRLRARGWRVLVQPASTVVHFEGVSSGRSLSAGVKAYQPRNQKRQAAAHAFALERHAPEQHVDPRALPRPRRPRILVIDATVPTPDKDSGSLTQGWFLRILVETGYDVTFAAENLQLSGRYGKALQALGVEVLHAPQIPALQPWLEAHAAEFDGFLLTRVTAGGKYAALLRAIAPRVPLIFATVDLHYLREERAAALPGAPREALAKARETKAQELALIALATDTILVSTAERDLLRAEGVTAPLSVISLVIEPRAEPAWREGREGIAFVGGFQHTPNVDAVLGFVKEVWPLVRARHPDLLFHVAGSNAPPEIAGLKAEGVVVHGHVPDLVPFLDARLASVAPLRWGAGVKGKVGGALARGLPCIASPLAAEGMGLTPGHDILVADGPEEFAEAVSRIVSDADLWQHLSEAGRAFATREYAPEAAKAHLLRLLAKAGIAPFSGTCPITGREEAWRFDRMDAPESLGPGPEGPGSAERVLAVALARHLGTEGRPLARRAPGAHPGGGIEAGPDLPHLSAALDRLGLAGAAPPASPVRVLLARLALDAAAPDALAALLKARPGLARLALALVPQGRAVGDPAAPPGPAAALAETLSAAGWEIRADRMALPECALTGVILLEARRRKGPP